MLWQASWLRGAKPCDVIPQRKTRTKTKQSKKQTHLQQKETNTQNQPAKKNHISFMPKMNPKTSPLYLLVSIMTIFPFLLCWWKRSRFQSLQSRRFDFFCSNAIIALARSLCKCLLAVLITASEAKAVIASTRGVELYDVIPHGEKPKTDTGK